MGREDKNVSVRLDLETRAKEAGLTEYEAAQQLEEVEPNYRSRLVARGDQEEAEIRSDSPTCDIEVINIICSVAACYRWLIGTGDLENAYFNAEKLTRALILRFPKGGLPGKSLDARKHRL